jgi:hypothetical protein
MDEQAMIAALDRPSRRARFVTAAVVGTMGFVVVRRLPRPVRPLADLALASSAPLVARYLTRLGV